MHIERFEPQARREPTELSYAYACVVSQPFEYFVSAERDVNAHCAPCDEMVFSSFAIGAMVVGVVLIALVLVRYVLMRRCPERAMRFRHKVITLADEYTALNKLKVSVTHCSSHPWMPSHCCTARTALACPRLRLSDSHWLLPDRHTSGDRVRCALA